MGTNALAYSLRQIGIKNVIKRCHLISNGKAWTVAIASLDETPDWVKCYKTFRGRTLRMFVMS
jgi:hypothetical protein